MNPPCKDCITFAICKAQMQFYIEQHDRRTTTIGLMQELDPKCKQITAYIKELITQARKDEKVHKLPAKQLLQRLHEIAKDIFA